jgi:hypothetical protein
MPRNTSFHKPSNISRRTASCGSIFHFRRDVATADDARRWRRLRLPGPVLLLFLLRGVFGFFFLRAPFTWDMRKSSDTMHMLRSSTTGAWGKVGTAGATVNDRGLRNAWIRLRSLSLDLASLLCCVVWWWCKKKKRRKRNGSAQQHSRSLLRAFGYQGYDAPCYCDIYL